MEPDDFELQRRLAKLKRTGEFDCHPFDRERTPPVDQMVFDDKASAAAVLIAITGCHGKIGIAPIQLFELIDRPTRRILIKSLMITYPPFNHPHPLGDSVEQVKETLRAKTAGHPNILIIGMAIGGHQALLLGAALGASTVIAVNPVTTLNPEIRLSFGDDRVPEFLDNHPQSFLDAHGDIPTIWRSTPPKRVIVHYSYRVSVLRHHAEHLADFPQVQLVPHYEYQVMEKIAADGTLRRLLHHHLDPRDRTSAA